MKKHQINFRLSEETFQLIKDYAKAYDIDATTYAKICCMDIINGSWLLNANDYYTEKEKSTKQMNFRLSEEIYLQISKMAGEYNMSITQFVRLCCIQTVHNRTIPACTIRAKQRQKYDGGIPD